MLVLTRRDGETIDLPDLGIRLVVVKIRGDAVRLGVEAPADVRVYRGEIWAEIEPTEEDAAP